jgi:hypothetical protein
MTDIIYHNGGAFHLTDGNWHRTDGPAVEFGGVLHYWVHGQLYTTNESFQKAAGISDDDMMVMVLKYGPVC